VEQSIRLLKLQREKGTLLRWDTLVDPDSPVQDPFHLRFRSAAWALISAFNGGNVDLAVERTLELVGLGPGLTPSGDDFLYGFSLAAWLLSSAPQIGGPYGVHGDGLVAEASGAA